MIVPSPPSGAPPLPEHPDLNFWKVADLWHTLLSSLGLPSVALGEVTTAFGGEIRPGRGRREIILVG